jgi:hypothetical protein
MSLPERLKSPGAVMQFLDSVDGREIVKYFQEMTEKSTRVCRNSARTLDEIRYAQGAADAAEKIVTLKKDIQQYQDDLRTGKVKPPPVVGEKKL